MQASIGDNDVDDIVKEKNRNTKFDIKNSSKYY